MDRSAIQCKNIGRTDLGTHSIWRVGNFGSEHPSAQRVLRVVAEQ